MAWYYWQILNMQKILAQEKHSDLFFGNIDNEEKRFCNIDL